MIVGIALALGTIRTPFNAEDASTAAAPHTSGSTDGFYNAITGDHRSVDDMIKARELISDEKVRGLEQGVMEGCELQGSTVVATAGPSFVGWYTRADREQLLRSLFHKYSTIQEISRVEMGSKGGRVLATYTVGVGYSGP